MKRVTLLLEGKNIFRS